MIYIMLFQYSLNMIVKKIVSKLIDNDHIPTSFVYFVFTRLEDDTDVFNVINFHGKVGKGTGTRWKSFITEYSHGYTVAMIDTDARSEIESEIKRWGRARGFINKKKREYYSISQ